MTAQVLTRTDRAVHPTRLRPGPTTAEATVVFRLDGELDAATAPGLSRALTSALDQRPARLALDLRAITFLDSSGTRVLIAAARRAHNEGCSLVVRSPSRPVLRMLRLTGLDRVLTVEPTPSSA